MLGLNLNFDVSLLFPLAISLLIGGALFYYFYTRINVLESSIINQGKILQTFISGNIIPQTAGETQTDNNNVNFNEDNEEKIDISDDEDDDNNSEESDESDESDDDNINLNKLNLEDSEDMNNKTESYEKDTAQLNILNLGGETGVPTMEILANILQMDSEGVEVNSDLLTHALSLEETDVIKVIDMNSSNLEEINNEQNLSDELKKKSKSLNKMNVKELQEYVSKKGLNTNSDISKLKKAELLELITKENSN
jgi:hypothetical protein